MLKGQREKQRIPCHCTQALVAVSRQEHAAFACKFYIWAGMARAWKEMSASMAAVYVTQAEWLVLFLSVSRSIWAKEYVAAAHMRAKYPRKASEVVMLGQMVLDFRAMSLSDRAANLTPRNAFPCTGAVWNPMCARSYSP